MNYSKIASKLRSKLSKFSGVVSAGLDKTAARFIKEASYGILSSQSVMLTEIGRSLETDVSLKKIEERFCRQLYKEDIWDKLHENVLSDAGQRVTNDTLLILDLGDIHKKYAEKMEHLARVRDGSEAGEIVNGYWTNQVIATTLHSNEALPLYHDLYSQQAPGFKSENTEIIKAIDKVSQHTEQRGIWIIDRGGDRGVLFAHFIGKKLRFTIRLVGDRHLLCGRGKKSALDLANQCKCLYTDTIIKEEDGQEKTYHISYGYLKVRLPNHPDSQLYMLVVKGFGKKPMMLLTTEPLRRNRRVLQKVLKSYIKRWSIEETIRFIKQTYDLENIRVLKYRRLRNMMALLLVVFYFLAVVLDTSAKLKVMTGHILKQAKRVFGIPDFKYYALGDGISSIFKRSPGLLPNKSITTNPAQLAFGFT